MEIGNKNATRRSEATKCSRKLKGIFCWIDKLSKAIKYLKDDRNHSELSCNQSDPGSNAGSNAYGDSSVCGGIQVRRGRSDLEVRDGGSVGREVKEGKETGKEAGFKAFGDPSILWMRTRWCVPWNQAESWTVHTVHELASRRGRLLHNLCSSSSSE